jgi:hypothetical protein
MSVLAKEDVEARTARAPTYAGSGTLSAAIPLTDYSSRGILVMVEVLGTDEFESWFLGLSTADADAVVRVVGLLEAKGLRSGFPTPLHLREAVTPFASFGFRASDALCESFTPSTQSVRPF